MFHSMTKTSNVLLVCKTWFTIFTTDEYYENTFDLIAKKYVLTLHANMCFYKQVIRKRCPKTFYQFILSLEKVRKYDQFTLRFKRLPNHEHIYHLYANTRPTSFIRYEHHEYNATYATECVKHIPDLQSLIEIKISSNIHEISHISSKAQLIGVELLVAYHKRLMMFSGKFVTFNDLTILAPTFNNLAEFCRYIKWIRKDKIYDQPFNEIAARIIQKTGKTSFIEAIKDWALSFHKIHVYL